jgi:ABC-type antimicrobial peptide transport system permease subunit
MFKNYLKTAYRSLVRHANYTLINISGLAMGIAVCLVIFIIIKFERSFDDFHQKKDRIYRVLSEYHHSDAANVFYGKGLPFALPAGLKAHFTQLEKVAPFYTEGNDQLLVLDDNGQVSKKFKEETGVFVTTPSFFDIFDFPLVAGNPSTALASPNCALLTKETAEKYFGNWKRAMGKTIKWDNRDLVKVTGILAPIPANTDFPLKVVLSYGTGYTANFAKATTWDGSSGNFGCFILLPPGMSVPAFNNQLREYSKQMQPADDKDSHIIQPISEVHFDTHSGNWSGKSISPELIRALWMIAAFILLIACVNFINLSTAQAVNRAREVGVRKVLGSNRTQLKLQFLIETAMIVLVAEILAVVLVLLTLPWISRLLDLQLSYANLLGPAVTLFLVVIMLAVTVLAGFYPSLVLAGFSPINALKSKLTARSSSGFSLRKALVVFQFIIAQGLIIGTLIMVKQMNLFITRPIGFDKEAVVNVPFPSDSLGISKLHFVGKQLSEINGIKNFSFNSTTPIENDNDNWTKLKYNHAAKETDFWAIIKWTDDQYLPTYKLPLVAGLNLEPSDTPREFLVDELLIKNLGIKNPQDALNKQISLWDGRIKGPIVGVIKEFNSRSFRDNLAPVLITSMKQAYSNVAIKLSTQEIGPTMKSIEKIWSGTYPDYVFEYEFLDSKIAGFYKQERQLSDLYQVFAVISIFLSCLGLLGLASFMAVQRIKEVGIRKVLGASAAQIVYLFSKEFIVLVGLAFLIACPIAWYFMHQWLQDYPYRIEMSWWIFGLGGVCSILIALATVSFQAVKAALANPVTSIRTE